MKIRIFERDESLRNLLELICQWVGSEVEVASLPVQCPAYSAQASRQTCCSGRQGILIIDAHLAPVSGLDWIESQAHGHCQVRPENKLILATHWTAQELERAQSLGCMAMRKPFRTSDLRDWLLQRVSSQAST